MLATKGKILKCQIVIVRTVSTLRVNIERFPVDRASFWTLGFEMWGPLTDDLKRMI